MGRDLVPSHVSHNTMPGTEVVFNAYLIIPIFLSVLSVLRYGYLMEQTLHSYTIDPIPLVTLKAIHLWTKDFL